MNQQPDDQTGANSTYSSQPGTQTNPFTADLKGEFTSNFGTNTNAVSQIFKEGQFSQGRSKVLIGGGIAVLLLLVGYLFFMDDDGLDDGLADTQEIQQDSQLEQGEQLGGDEDAGDMADEDAGDMADEDGDEMADEDGDEMADEGGDEMADEGGDEMAGEMGDEMADAGQDMAPATDAPVLTGPDDGAARGYDETSASAEFSWEGSPGGYVVLSRSRSMSPQIMKVRVSGNSYMFTHPWPGTWYWRVDNGAGSSEVRSFRIAGTIRRNVQVAEPQSGGSVSGNGGMVSWTGDTNVAHYRVELTNGSWANPMHKFATSGTQAQLQGVQPGEYQMRVGAFSEVAGRWEFTNPISVTVQ